MKIATHNVQDGDEFTPMTTTPLTRLGWWLRSIPGLRQNKDGWDEVDDLAERILSAFDAAVSAIMSGSEPGGPYIERGQAIRIAELEQRLEHAGQLRRQRNRMPRVPITAKERLEWVAKHAAGKSYAEIGDEAGRHPAVVRRIILEGKE